MTDQQPEAPQDRPAGQAPPVGAPQGAPIPSPQDTPRPPYGPQGQQHPGPPVPPGHAQPPMTYAGAAPLAPSEARMWSIFAHLGGTFLSFLVPLVIYIVFKDRDPFVRRHSATALNFHITLAIAYAVSAVLVLVLIGLFLIPLLWVLALVFTIMAAVAAGDGRDYQYPLSITFVH
jgi:uncharacterized Tic20 family protein